MQSDSSLLWQPATASEICLLGPGAGCQVAMVYRAGSNMAHVSCL